MSCRGRGKWPAGRGPGVSKLLVFGLDDPACLPSSVVKFVVGHEREHARHEGRDVRDIARMACPECSLFQGLGVEQPPMRPSGIAGWESSSFPRPPGRSSAVVTCNVEYT
jgi:hypothetical protein